MAEKREHEDGSDEEPVESYLHNVIPHQCSVDGNIYYGFSLQTIPKKKEKFAVYRAKKLNKVFESKSP